MPLRLAFIYPSEWEEQLERLLGVLVAIAENR